MANSSGAVQVKSAYVNYPTSNGIDGGWERISVVFTPGTSGTYRAVFGVENSTNIVAAFDDIQLEVGKTQATGNLVQYGSFEFSDETHAANTDDLYWDWTDDTAWIAKGGYAGTNDYIATDDYLGTDNYDATDDYVASVDYDNTPDYNTPDNTPDYDDTPVKTTTKKTTTTQTTTTKTVKNTPDTPDRNTPDRDTPDRNTPDNTPDYDNT